MFKQNIKPSAYLNIVIKFIQDSAAELPNFLSIV